MPGPPEIVLVVNGGSSSLKYRLVATADGSRQARGEVERIGIAGTRHAYRGPRGESARDLPQGGMADAFREMMDALTAPETGVMRDAGEVGVVVHRVVHGGERFTGATS